VITARHLAGFLLLIASLPGTSAAEDEEKSWRISDFQTSVVVDDRAAITVTERLTMKFTGEYHGIHRYIPDVYEGPTFIPVFLRLNVLSVTDGDGGQLRYSDGPEGDNRKLTIYIPGAKDATKTVEITYTITNAIRFFDKYDELYWNVTGNRWEAPIDHASAVVRFPARAAGGLRGKFWTGFSGSQEQNAKMEIDGAAASFVTTAPLEAYAGLTVSVTVPHGVLAKPSLITMLGSGCGDYVMLLVPVLALIAILVIRFVWGRTPSPAEKIGPLSEPPDGWGPAECGALLTRKVQNRQVVATVVDLAARGYFSIREAGRRKFSLVPWRNYKFTQTRDAADWDQLKLHERDILAGLFADRRETELQAHGASIGSAFDDARGHIRSALSRKDVYRVAPGSKRRYVVRTFWAIAGAWVLALFAIVFTLGISNVSLIITFFGLPVLFVVTKVSIGTVWSLNVDGARAQARVRSFLEFIRTVESDHLRTAPPDTFETHLPYAIAFGIEKRWTKAFAGIALRQPSWYTGANFDQSFHTGRFMRGVGSLGWAVRGTSSLTSNWSGSGGSSSSSSSGFDSGGGSSGGGFGGGGGDAF
jgi:uncharacterized membrane protein